MPVVPNQPRNRPDKSGSGAPFENQSEDIEEEPILQISPDGSTTSRPQTMSELNPYCCVSLPCPWIITFDAIVAAGGASGIL